MSDLPGAPQDSSSQAVNAQVKPENRLDKILAVVPRALSSHAHIVFLFGLGIFLVLLPLLGVNVSSKAELIGGNYTNVTSDLGACIAAGLTVHLVKRDHRRSRELEDFLDRIHARHDDMSKAVDEAVAAAKQAAAAAERSDS